MYQKKIISLNESVKEILKLEIGNFDSKVQTKGKIELLELIMKEFDTSYLKTNFTI